VQVTASDEDSGELGTVKYTILSVSNEGKRKFAINADNGQIYVTQPVTLGELFILMVQGEDQGRSSGRRSVPFLHNTFINTNCCRVVCHMIHGGYVECQLVKGARV